MENIIVQDNDKEILEILTIALKEAGYNVMPTVGYEHILDQIDRFRPHIVMLDFKLSGEECIEAYKLIRGKYPHLPVLALSCNNNIHSEYSKVGFDGYIEKPFDIDHMYSILRKHMPNKDMATTYQEV